jgi:hypothetical protein
MTTDTKAVARWDWVPEDMHEYQHGDYVLFTDHERVVGELQAGAATTMFRMTDALDKQIEELRTALAASRAEVEGLKKDAERYRWLLKNWQFDKESPISLWFDIDGLDDTNKANAALDAAMEKGNDPSEA